MLTKFVVIAALLSIPSQTTSVGETTDRSSPSRIADQRAAAPLTNLERQEVVVRLAELLASDYVVADIGNRYAGMLRQQLAAGAYDTFTDPVEFSAAITRELQAIAPDGHLRVGLKDTFGHPRPQPADAPASTRPHGPPGLEAAEMIGDVAYLRFNAFPDDPKSAETARSFLLAHLGARALIIDCRPNRGGGLSVMNAILPLLYDRPVTQVRMDTRVSADNPPETEDDPTLVRRDSPVSIVRYDHVITPDLHHTRLRTLPIFYLTSRRTASAAEHLAMGFRRNHRARIIGETTAGANHYGDVRPLGERLAAFIPVGRSYDPTTGTDWEGTGIAPDKYVPSDEALREALQEANARR